MLNRAVPFARHVGVTIEAMDGDGAQASLPQADELLNHVGSQHAGALFTLAEAASGAAMISALGDLLSAAVPLVRTASISYRKVARGPISASARLMQPMAEVRAAFERDGRADFDIGVALVDENNAEVATVTVEWSLRTKPAKNASGESR